jgi:hypothetical protein
MSNRRMQQQRWRRRIAPARQDVQDDIRGVDILGDRFGAGGIHRGKAAGQHSGEDVHHLAIAVFHRSQSAPQLLQSTEQDPVPERGAVAQGARFASQDRHIVPGVVDCPAVPEVAGVVADKPAL